MFSKHLGAFGIWLLLQSLSDVLEETKQKDLGKILVFVIELAL